MAKQEEVDPQEKERLVEVGLKEKERLAEGACWEMAKQEEVGLKEKVEEACVATARKEEPMEA